MSKGRAPSRLAIPMPVFPTQGLQVNEHGPVGLPLTVADAQVITSRAQQSAFGKGSKTYVDSTVRRSWELNPDQFSLRNPRWDDAIAALLPQVREQLGLPCGAESIRADLYKLLLYEEGAFFKPHQDSEKVPGMFGTLMVALPSPHQGGDLSLKHNKEAVKFATAANSEFGFSWAAWYSDVFHEVLPVTAGWRLVLTYNLVMRPGTAVASVLPNLSSYKPVLKSVLREWESGLARGDADRRDLPPYLVHRLEHQYTQASLSLQRLKGKDRAQVNILHAAADATDVSIFLASTEREVLRDDEGDEDLIDDTLRFKHVARLDGSKIFGEMEFKDSVVIHPVEVEEREADDEEHSGFTGNEGCTATYWYRDTAVVIVPSAGMVDLQFHGDHKYRNALQRIMDLKATLTESPNSQGELYQLCKKILERPIRYSFTYRINTTPESETQAHATAKTQVALLALERGNFKLFDEAFSQHKYGLSEECYHQLGRSLAIHAEDTKKRIKRVINALESASEKYEAFQRIVGGLECAEENALSSLIDLESWKEWCDDCFINLVTSSQRMLSKVDGIALAKICGDLDNANQIARIKSLVMSASASVKAGFCIKLSETKQGKNNKVLKEILESYWNRFKLMSQDEASAAFSKSPGDDSDKVATYILCPNELADLLTLTEAHLQSLDLSQQDICTKLTDACLKLSNDGLLSLLQPFAALVVAKKVPLTCDSQSSLTPDACKFVTVVVYALLKYYVGTKPLPPDSWSQPDSTSTCRCVDCQAVNAFLESPVEKVGSFRLNERKRRHLHLQFTDKAKYCSYAVETIRTGSPYAWQITKNKQQYQTQLKAWQGRANDAQSRLNEMDTPAQFLKSVLGDSYQDVITLKLPHAVDKLQPRWLPLSETSNNQKRKSPADSANGSRKRMATGDVWTGTEVVDLTSD